MAKTTDPRHWSDAHLALLRAHYPTTGTAKLVALTGRPIRTIVDKAFRLGISTTRQGGRKPAPKPPKPVAPPKPKPAPKPTVKALKPAAPPRHDPRPKAKNTLKPLAIKGALRPGPLGTPLLNERKATKQRDEQAIAKRSVVDDLKRLPPDSPGRRLYAETAARQGGPAANAAFRAWQLTQQPA